MTSKGKCQGSRVFQKKKPRKTLHISSYQGQLGSNNKNTKRILQAFITKPFEITFFLSKMSFKIWMTNGCIPLTYLLQPGHNLGTPYPLPGNPPQVTSWDGLDISLMIPLHMHVWKKNENPLRNILNSFMTEADQWTGFYMITASVMKEG